MMADEEASLPAPAQDCCRKLVDSVSGERYFAHVSRAGGQGFRLEITDCTDAWIAEVKEPPRDAVVEEWMSLAQRAIAPRLFRNTGGPSSFSYRLSRDPSGDLKIQWSWGVQKVKASVLATRQTHEAGRSVAAELMDALVDKHEALQEEHSGLTSAFSRLRDEATTATEELERAQDERQRLEEQLYAKFAALLNEKKRRCKALNEEVTALRHQLDEQGADVSSGTSGSGLSGGGGDAAGDEEKEEEEDGRSELSRGGTQPGRAHSHLGSSRMEDRGKEGGAAEATPVSKRRRSVIPRQGEEQEEGQAVVPPLDPPPKGSSNSGVRETLASSSGTHPEGHQRAGEGEEAVLRKRWEERREDLAAATVPLSAEEGEGGREPDEGEKEGKQQQQQPEDELGAEGEVKLKARRRKRPKGAAPP